MTWEKKRVLVTVKAAPEPSKKYHEGVVCTAGITDRSEFIRLYPIPFELFYRKEGPKKFEWIEVECEKAIEKLSRKESYKVKPGSIKVIDTSLSSRDGQKVNWDERSKYVLPMKANSVEDLRHAFDVDRTSLGLVKVAELIDFYERANEDEDEVNTKRYMQVVFDQIQNRGTFSKIPVLDKIEHVHSYKFRCEGASCTTHDMTMLDWELYESLRSWKYPKEEFPAKLRQQFFENFKKTDLYFFLGTTSLQPSWVIIGAYRPPKDKHVDINTAFG
jgi:hypothetical protein